MIVYALVRSRNSSRERMNADSSKSIPSRTTKILGFFVVPTLSGSQVSSSNIFSPGLSPVISISRVGSATLTRLRPDRGDGEVHRSDAVFRDHIVGVPQRAQHLRGGRRVIQVAHDVAAALDDIPRQRRARSPVTDDKDGIVPLLQSTPFV